MITVDNIYTKMQQQQYSGGTSNHEEHNANPEYWSLLLGDIKINPLAWQTKTALDFGCGAGRNVVNLQTLANWSTVDGVDISLSNITKCKELNLSGANFYQTNGVDLQPLKDAQYDFVLSTIVFQHICVYDIRKALFKELFRVLKAGGLFSFQMGFGPSETARVQYYQNHYDAKETNGNCDVRVSDTQQLITDLTEIGFKDINCTIRPSWSDHGHPNWIYVKAFK